jgi:hypothetical protein
VVRDVVREGTGSVPGAVTGGDWIVADAAAVVGVAGVGALRGSRGAPTSVGCAREGLDRSDSSGIAFGTGLATVGSAWLSA